MKNDFMIYTDSACDLTQEMLQGMNVKCLPLSFIFDGDSNVYNNSDMPEKEFYDKMRKGSVAKTSAANTELIKSYLQPELEAGKDVLYVAFSSGLSVTYTCACTAKEELSTEFPERKIMVFDSLCASAGMGLMVTLAAEKKESGSDIEETFEYLTEIRPRLCHWFTVDDLVYLKRGGRISKATALVGEILHIKPLLRMNDEGKLESVSKCKGRKHALKALCDRVGENNADLSQKMYISHGDCKEDADLLARMIKEKYGKDIDVTVYIGPVIGAHSGPGTLALFFIGSKR